MPQDRGSLNETRLFSLWLVRDKNLRHQNLMGVYSEHDHKRPSPRTP